MSALSEGLKEGWSNTKRSFRNAPATAKRVAKSPRSIVAGAPLAPLIVLYGHTLIDAVDRTGFNVILPEVRDEFGLDLQAASSIASVSIFVALLLSVPIAFWSDRTKRRTWFLAGGALLAGVFAGLSGVATGITLFVVARGAFGLGLRLNDPVQSSLMADYYEVGTRPTIFAGREMTKNAGQLIGPLFFGVVAQLFGWRAAVLAVAIPSLALAVWSWRLREPVRGAPERAELGLTGDDADVEEEPPSFEEALQILRRVGTIRRLWHALPFIIGGLTSYAVLFPLYLEEVFGLGPAERGLVGAFNEPVGIVALLFAIPISAQFLRSGKPERLFGMMGVSSLVVALSIGLMAIAPNIPVLLFGSVVLQAASALLAPGIAVLFAMITPPRVRTVGYAFGALWALPGLIMLPVAGGLGDALGLRWGMLVGLPIFLIGAFMVASSGGAFRADMQATLVAAGAAAEARRAREEGRTSFLVCRGVDLSYGQVQVLFGVDFDVEEGEMVALLGTNGAGKSSLLRAISGTAQPGGGTILFDGRDITQASSARTSSIGVVQVPGGRGVFPTMTVGENLRVATWLFRRDPAHVEASVERVLEMFPVLRERFDTPAGNLSGGEQQMLTLGQAFVGKPKLLLIDELSLGLAPALVQQLLDVVRAIHAEGVTIGLVEQSVNVALTVCDRAVFLEKGEVRFEGKTADLLDRPDVLRSVFLEGAARPERPSEREVCTGETVASPATARRRIDLAQLEQLGIELPVLLEARGLVRRFGGIRAVDDVSLQLHQGEILGLIGSNGAGKTTIFDLLSGFLTPDGGRILFDGIDVTDWSPDQRARARLGRSFQDARLFPSLTVAEAIAVALERHVEVPDVLSAACYLPGARESEDRIRDRVDELIELMGLEAFRDKFIAELSTGSRRIVDLACTMAHEPKVLLLDEPSSGIAQRETEALGPLLLRVQKETNTSLLVIEHDIPLISSISDRLIALEIGRTIAEGAPDDVLDDPRVIASYLGTDEAVIARSGGQATKKKKSNGRRQRRVREEERIVNPQTKLALTRWGPFGGIVVVLGLLLLLAPTKAPERTNAFAGVGAGSDVSAAGATSGSTATGATGSASSVGGAQSGAGTGTGAAAQGTAGAAGGGSTAPAASAPTTGEDCTRQQILGSGTCKPLWAGDNGGSTYKGVSGDAIKVVYYMAKANEQVNAILRAGGAGASREEVKHTIQMYVQFFNKHIQSYGRKLDVVIYEGEAESGDAAAFRAEAVKIDQEIGAFMVISAGNTDMIDELSRRGIVCICGAQLPGKFHIERAPFVYGLLSDGDTTNKHISEYICKRLGPGGGVAEYAGQIIHPTIGGRDTPRRWGMSFPANGFGTPNAEDLEARLKSCGIAVVRKNAYASDINTAGQQSTTSVQGSIEAKVTSVLCVCDPIAPVFGTQAASQQQWYPEWFQTGYLLQDATFFGRLYDQNQWNHNFGISTLGVPRQRSETTFYKAYKSEDPDGEPPVGAELIYPAFLVGFTGIELAGPTLDPGTYRDAMYSINVVSTDKHTVAFGYGPDDFGGIDDAREVWWDPTGIDPADDKPGTYHSVNDGARYLPGEWPSTKPGVFRPECDAPASCGEPAPW